MSQHKQAEFYQMFSDACSKTKLQYNLQQNVKTTTNKKNQPQITNMSVQKEINHTIHN